MTTTVKAAISESVLQWCQLEWEEQAAKNGDASQSIIGERLFTAVDYFKDSIARDEIITALNDLAVDGEVELYGDDVGVLICRPGAIDAFAAALERGEPAGCQERGG